MRIKHTPSRTTPREVARDVRRSIVDGRLNPGSRLPTREEIRNSSGASPLTVQRAFDRLLKDGFIVTRGRDGTYVSDAPPHLHQYALVFPGIDRGLSTYFDLLARCVTQAAGPSNHVKIYENVLPTPKCKAYRALRADVRRQRLAGIIFALAPFALTDSPLLEKRLPIPRVGVMTPADYAPFPTIYPDHRSLIELGLDELKARGRRRVAVITTLGESSGSAAHLDTAIASRRLICPPRWRVPVAPLELSTVSSVVRLLFHPRQNECPDALLLTDTHHLEPALSGLLAEGVRIPEDVEIAAHANFPLDTPPSLPIRRVGFDISALAVKCFDLLRRQRDSRRTPSFEWCPAVPLDTARHIVTPFLAGAPA